MVKQLVLGAFEEFTPSFISNGWPHERSDPADFATLAMFQNSGMTVGDVLEGPSETLGGTKVTGTAEQAGSQLEDRAEHTEVDGFLIEHTVGGIATLSEFIDEVMPILRERGVVLDRPRTGSLRELLTGTPTARLEPSHPGGGYRKARA